MLDHLAQQQSGDRHQSRSASPAGPHGVAKDLGAGGDVARQAIDTDEETQAPRGSADHGDDGHDQGEIATLADHTTQPEPRRHGHRHGHPEPAGDRLDVEFVGLDMAQLDLTSKDPMLMELLSMAAGPITPIGDGSFVEAEGGTMAWTGQP